VGIWCAVVVCVWVCRRLVCRPTGGWVVLVECGIGWHVCFDVVFVRMLCLCFYHVVRVCGVMCSAQFGFWFSC